MKTYINHYITLEMEKELELHREPLLWSYQSIESISEDYHSRVKIRTSILPLRNITFVTWMLDGFTFFSNVHRILFPISLMFTIGWKLFFFFIAGT